MKLTKKTTTLTALALAAGALHAEPTDKMEALLDDTKAIVSDTIPGKFSINSRTRFESFDLAVPSGSLPNGTPSYRQGFSTRVRYGYTTPNFVGFTAMVEGEALTRIGGTANEVHFLDEAGDGTDLNQLWAQYAHEDFGKVKVGRQIYTLDDHRFIGHVGWRQNIQTFDAATFDFTGIEKFSFKGFYLDEQHAVNGTHNELEAFGVNATLALAPQFKLTAFYYNIEGDDVGAKNANQSNETFGFRATGAFTLVEDVKLKYAASFADQQEGDPSFLDYDASYYAGDLSLAVSGFTFGGGLEVLEPGFRTPLATVHKFNGFADALLPLNGFTNGLEDVYIYAGYTLPIGNGLKTKVIYHWYDSENGLTDGGEEFNLVASYKVNKYLSLMVKYGDYQTDGGVGTGGLGGSVGGVAGALNKRMFTFDVNFKF